MEIDIENNVYSSVEEESNSTSSTSSSEYRENALSFLYRKQRCISCSVITYLIILTLILFAAIALGVLYVIDLRKTTDPSRNLFKSDINIPQGVAGLDSNAKLSTETLGLENANTGVVSIVSGSISTISQGTDGQVFCTKKVDVSSTSNITLSNEASIQLTDTEQYEFGWVSITHDSLLSDPTYNVHLNSDQYIALTGHHDGNSWHNHYSINKKRDISLLTARRMLQQAEMDSSAFSKTYTPSPSLLLHSHFFFASANSLAHFSSPYFLDRSGAFVFVALAGSLELELFTNTFGDLFVQLFGTELLLDSFSNNSKSLSSSFVINTQLTIQDKNGYESVDVSEVGYLNSEDDSLSSIFDADSQDLSSIYRYVIRLKEPITNSYHYATLYRSLLSPFHSAEFQGSSLQTLASYAPLQPKVNKVKPVLSDVTATDIYMSPFSTYLPLYSSFDKSTLDDERIAVSKTQVNFSDVVSMIMYDSASSTPYLELSIVSHSQLPKSASSKPSFEIVPIPSDLSSSDPVYSAVSTCGGVIFVVVGRKEGGAAGEEDNINLFYSHYTLTNVTDVADMSDTNWTTLTLFSDTDFHHYRPEIECIQGNVHVMSSVSDKEGDSDVIQIQHYVLVLNNHSSDSDSIGFDETVSVSDVVTEVINSSDIFIAGENVSSEISLSSAPHYLITQRDPTTSKWVNETESASTTSALHIVTHSSVPGALPTDLPISHTITHTLCLVSSLAYICTLSSHSLMTTSKYITSWKSRVGVDMLVNIVWLQGLTDGTGQSVMWTRGTGTYWSGKEVVCNSGSDEGECWNSAS
ncbi:hypothetical protein ADUPG1_009768, partial [Aduncisulcus paluster]